MEHHVRKKHKRKFLLRFLIALLVIHVVLNIIHLPFTVEEKVEEEIELIDTSTGREKLVTNCEQRDYEWTYRWEGYNEVEGPFVSPRFRFFNTENRSGTFTVQFGFYNQEEHDFAEYEGIAYDIVEDQLPWDLAEMHSKSFTFTIGDNDERLITSYTQRKDPDVPYWTYAQVTAPKLTECTTETVVLNDSVQEVRYETRVKTVEKKVYYSLWEILMSFLGFE